MVRKRGNHNVEGRNRERTLSGTSRKIGRPLRNKGQIGGEKFNLIGKEGWSLPNEKGPTRRSYEKS